MACPRVAALAIAAGMGVVGSAAEHARAFDLGAMTDPLSGYTAALLGAGTGREVWTGADVSNSTWLIFSGLTYAPLGGIFDNGPRIRLMTGYGEYRYLRASTETTSVFGVKKTYGDLLAGYQQRMQSLTAKVFVGLSFISHEISPLDDGAPVSGDDVGFKALVELWLNMGDSAWASIDAAWAEPFNTTNVRSRLGYRVLPRVSLGIEGGLNLDEAAICRLAESTPGHCAISPSLSAAKTLITSGRGGLFGRYDWGDGEVSLAIGASGENPASEAAISPYATLQWLTQF